MDSALYEPCRYLCHVFVLLAGKRRHKVILYKVEAWRDPFSNLYIEVTLTSKEECEVAFVLCCVFQKCTELLQDLLYSSCRDDG
jgi:hypothetical protein